MNDWSNEWMIGWMNGWWNEKSIAEWGYEERVKYRIRFQQKQELILTIPWKRSTIIDWFLFKWFSQA